MINAAYPDVYAFGDELIIRPDGRISWHIGAAGAAGTYEVYNNQLSAIVSDIMEFDEYQVGLTLGEYVRNRRLYLAAMDLVGTDDRIT